MNLGRGVNGVLLVVVVALASAVIPVAAASEQTSGAAALVAPSSQLFGFTGATQFFTVPAGVHQVHLTAWGGGRRVGGRSA